MNGRVRRLGGRQGSRTDARPALRHRRLRGHPLLRHRDRPGGLPPPATTSTACSSRPSSTTCRSRTTREELRQATLELIGRNGLRSLLHPPARLPRLRADGPVPARRAGRRHDRGLGVGRLPRRGGQAQRHPREGLVVAADQPGLADPARQGLRASTSTPCSRRSRRHKAGYEEAILLDDQRPRLRGLGREHLRRPRRRDLHAAADRLDPRRHQPQVGDPDRARPRLSRSSSATSRAPSSTSPTRSS